MQFSADEEEDGIPCEVDDVPSVTLCVAEGDGDDDAYRRARYVEALNRAERILAANPTDSLAQQIRAACQRQLDRSTLHAIPVVWSSFDSDEKTLVDDMGHLLQAQLPAAEAEDGQGERSEACRRGVPAFRGFVDLPLTAGARAQFVWERIDGVSTVGEIVALSGLPSEEAHRLLEEFERAGWIDVLRTPSAARAAHL